jgi:murein DD-endopeptidase MepM/ murein hydrolase activator NlpD
MIESSKRKIWLLTSPAKKGWFSLRILILLLISFLPLNLLAEYALASDLSASPSSNPIFYSSLIAPSLVSTRNINTSPTSNILIQNYGLLALPIPSNQEVLYQDDNIDSIFIYYVEKDETISSIAKKFDISVETLLSTNNLSSQSTLKVGQELTILPVSGILYTIKNGDSVKSIAKKYKANIDDILAFNNLNDDSVLNSGQKIIIPNGQSVEDSYAPNNNYIAQNYPSSAPGYVSALTPAGFIVYPTTGKNWGRRHYYNAVDIANSCGTPVYAAADGIAVSVALTNSRSTYANGGYGNNIRIQHSNNILTLYAHLKEVFISEGQEVKQGQLIALMGGQPGMIGAGHSTGCHLHFEVRGATNPLVRY